MSVPDSALPNSKAHPAGFRATTQVTLLVLCGSNIRRKRHESVMGVVMKDLAFLHVQLASENEELEELPVT